MKPSIVLLLAVITACEVGITHDSEKPQEDTSEEATVNEETIDEELDEETEDSAEPEPAEEDDEPLTDFSQWGPHYPYGITKESRTAAVTNCSSMEYEVYTPYADNPPVVILGHGFARGSGVMTGWAEHLSSWGVEVLLPTLCHYNVFAGVDHEMNGQNMRELAALHGVTNVVYAGHSAGGLAAIIAASQDPTAAGVLGLDATDTDGVPGVPDLVGTGYAGSVTAPAFSIQGEPSSCNAENNGLNLFRMMSNYTVVKVNSADHCDFENPTDMVCTMSCENSSSSFFEDSEIRSAITTLGTAAIMMMTGTSTDGIGWWTDEGLEPWIQSGLIQGLE